MKDYAKIPESQAIDPAVLTAEEFKEWRLFHGFAKPNDPFLEGFDESQHTGGRA